MTLFDLENALALAWIPLQSHAYGLGFRALLLSGMLALIGLAMIIPMFLPGRWHGTRGYDDDPDVLELPAPTGLNGVYSEFSQLGQATGHVSQATREGASAGRGSDIANVKKQHALVKSARSDRQRSLPKNILKISSLGDWTSN